MKDLGKRIRRHNERAERDRKEMRSYVGLTICERCHTEQNDDTSTCRVCGMEL